MEFVAHAHKKVVGFFDLFKGVFGNEPIFYKLVEIPRSSFYPGDPKNILIVAQTSAGFLHIGFL